jgi:LmbE family N-acetylglucosaminyl deacetylase
LIFAPHPDDECVMGGLPRRLLCQSRMNVVDVAVTQGSQLERQQPRLDELGAACAFLGFGLITTEAGGLLRVTQKTRTQDVGHWDSCVRVIAGILERERPKIVLFPHDADWNTTHEGVHFLVMDALGRQAPGFSCYLVETEFWSAMTTPNLMVESSAEDVADLVAGLSCHVGEVKRVPYHLWLPAWMQDNVRRGSELVGGQGAAAPDFAFATLYRLRRFAHGAIQNVYEGGRMLAKDDAPDGLFV